MTEFSIVRVRGLPSSKGDKFLGNNFEELTGLDFFDVISWDVLQWVSVRLPVSVEGVTAIEESARTMLCTAEHVIIQCEISRAW